MTQKNFEIRDLKMAPKSMISSGESHNSGKYSTLEWDLWKKIGNIPRRVLHSTGSGISCQTVVGNLALKKDISMGLIHIKT